VNWCQVRVCICIREITSLDQILDYYGGMCHNTMIALDKNGKGLVGMTLMLTE